MEKDRTTTRFGEKLAQIHVKMRGVTDEQVRRALSMPTELVTAGSSVEMMTIVVDMEENSERREFASTRTA